MRIGFSLVSRLVRITNTSLTVSTHIVGSYEEQESGSGFVVPIFAYLCRTFTFCILYANSLVIQDDMSIMRVQQMPSYDLRCTNTQALPPDVHLQVAITLSACG